MYLFIIFELMNLFNLFFNLIFFEFNYLLFLSIKLFFIIISRHIFCYIHFMTHIYPKGTEVELKKQYK